jgi:hypothetical protein
MDYPTTMRPVIFGWMEQKYLYAPGAFSQPMTLGAPGPYHCSIHPDMVGTLLNQ